MAKVSIYGSSVSGNMKTKQSQQKIISILEGNSIQFEFVDLAADESAKEYMKSKNGGKAGVPQIFVDGNFIGLFEDFEAAIEEERLQEFLKQK